LHREHGGAHDADGPEEQGDEFKGDADGASVGNWVGFAAVREEEVGYGEEGPEGL